MGIVQTYVDKLVKEGKMPKEHAKWYETVNEAALLPDQQDGMVEDLRKEFDPQSK